MREVVLVGRIRGGEAAERRPRGADRGDARRIAGEALLVAARLAGTGLVLGNELGDALVLGHGVTSQVRAALSRYWYGVGWEMIPRTARPLCAMSAPTSAP